MRGAARRRLRSGSFVRSSRRLLGRRGMRQLEREDGPLAAPTLDDDASAKQRGEGTGDRETEAGPRVGLRVRVLELAERNEQAREVVLADPAAGVRDRDAHAAQVRLGAHRDPSAVGELRGVRREVHEDLAELVVVRLDDELAGDLRDHLDRLLADEEPRERRHLVQECGDVDGPDRDLHPARLELREVEDVVHGAAERRRRAEQQRDLRAHLLEVPPVARHPHELRDHRDRADRRAELVRRVGEEPGPDALELLEPPRPRERGLALEAGPLQREPLVLRQLAHGGVSEVPAVVSDDDHLVEHRSGGAREGALERHRERRVAPERERRQVGDARHRLAGIELVTEIARELQEEPPPGEEPHRAVVGDECDGLELRPVEEEARDLLDAVVGVDVGVAGEERADRERIGRRALQRMDGIGREAQRGVHRVLYAADETHGSTGASRTGVSMRVPFPTTRRVPRHATSRRKSPHTQAEPKTRSFSGTTASWRSLNPPGRRARAAAPSSAAFRAHVAARPESAADDRPTAAPSEAKRTGFRRASAAYWSGPAACRWSTLQRRYRAANSASVRRSLTFWTGRCATATRLPSTVETMRPIT